MALLSISRMPPWALFASIVGVVFFGMFTFEFIIEEQLERLFGMDHSDESDIEHWKYTIYTTLAVALALLAPFRIVGRGEREQKALNVRYKVLFEQTADYAFVLETHSEGPPIIIDGNEAAFEKHGYSRSELIGKPITFLDRGASKKLMAKRISRLQSGKLVHFEVEHTCKDDSSFWAEVAARRVIIDTREMIYTVERDITERKQAAEETQASLVEKEILLREIHHRVKNNMQVISSMLSLQANYTIDEQAQALFKDLETHIQSMALVHEKLYGATNLREINFGEYIPDLVSSLLSQYPDSQARVSVSVEVTGVALPVDKAIPCGLVISELMSNVFKHAFPDKKKGEVKIAMWQGKDGIISLQVTDNGIGFTDALDEQAGKTFGMRMLKTLVEYQLGGSIQVDGTKGTAFTITFKGEIDG